MDKDVMNSRELLSIFLFGEITSDNLIGSIGDEMDYLIELVDEETYDFESHEHTEGIEFLKGCDNHVSTFSRIQNDVLIEYEKFGSFRDGMELEWIKIEYVGSKEERQDSFFKKVKELGSLINKVEAIDDLEFSMKKAQELVEEWKLLK